MAAVMPPPPPAQDELRHGLTPRVGPTLDRSTGTEGHPGPGNDHPGPDPVQNAVGITPSFLIILRLLCFSEGL